MAFTFRKSSFYPPPLSPNVSTQLQNLWMEKKLWANCWLKYAKMHVRSETQRSTAFLDLYLSVSLSICLSICLSIYSIPFPWSKSIRTLGLKIFTQAGIFWLHKHEYYAQFNMEKRSSFSFSPHSLSLFSLAISLSLTICYFLSLSLF